jgi:hypothetical protein
MKEPEKKEIPEISPEMGEFICPICGRQFPTLEELHVHIQREHRRRPRIG